MRPVEPPDIKNRTAVALSKLGDSKGGKVKGGIANHIWTVEQIVGLLEASEPKSTRAAVSN